MISNRWFILSLLFLARTAMGVQFQTVGSLGPVLVDAFAIDYARLAALVGLYLLPGVVIAWPGGLFVDRIGAKKIALVGLATMAAGGLLMAAGTSFAMLIAARLVSGTGAILMNVGVTKMVADWYVGREIRTAMGILVSSWPLGIAVGLIAFAPLEAVFGWQAVMYAAALLCLVQLPLLAVFYRQPPAAPAQAAPAAMIPLKPREWRLVLIAGFIWGVYNVGFIVLVSFLPALFAREGYTLGEATGLVSALGWAFILLVPLGGYFADRYRRPDAVMAAGFVVAALASALLPLPQAMMPAFIVLMLAAGLPAGPIMALPASVLRMQVRGSGTGVYYAWSYALMATLPALAGLAQDLTNSAAAPMLFAAAMLVAALIGLAAFRVTLRVCARTPDDVHSSVPVR
ncbi:MAG TPA: MFS transporter [Xanthobacteraceae bacterium]|nr:MFS transporter [Xanthobacteraceae bacterium]